MSGTSLDGIDLALCRFFKSGNGWHFQILKAQTYDYPDVWKKKLIEAEKLNAGPFLKLHNEYGSYIGEKVHHFLQVNRLKADLIASHGHTIFHQPETGFTFQLGSGAVLASQSRITTVSDFRTLDMALGGQGAPLVPVGDELLFGEFKFCLNLGGFANISNRKGNRRTAGDICPVNIIANQLASYCGMEYDQDGLLGSGGNIIPGLVNELNCLEFYAQPFPKSLGREWVESAFLPVLGKYKLPVEDLIRSVYEHVAMQIGNYISQYEAGEVLVTGGGAFNVFLMDLIRKRSKSVLIIPDHTIVKFKEALIFAFLGLLRCRNEINCLASVTGARCDSSSGIIHFM
jgi:anhydro-N-acetylmuramic acid kinase